MPKANQRDDLATDMGGLAAAARRAAKSLGSATSEAKNAALIAMAANIRAAEARIAEANARDVALARGQNRTPAHIDRLTLTPERIEAMAKGLEDIAGLPDPVGAVIAKWTRPNGLEISRVRVPIGVIAPGEDPGTARRGLRGAARILDSIDQLEEVLDAQGL